MLRGGAYGTYLDLESAPAVVKLPRLSRDRYCQVGNAADHAAQLLLISRRDRQAATAVACRAHYIKLTSHAGFVDSSLNN